MSARTRSNQMLPEERGDVKGSSDRHDVARHKRHILAPKQLARVHADGLSVPHDDNVARVGGAGITRIEDGLTQSQVGSPGQHRIPHRANDPDGLCLNGLRLDGLRLNGLRLSQLRLSELRLSELRLNELRLLLLHPGERFPLALFKTRLVRRPRLRVGSGICCAAARQESKHEWQEQPKPGSNGLMSSHIIQLVV